MKKILVIAVTVLSINVLWGELVLEIETDKEEYILYEPIMIKITLRNEDKITHKIIPYLDPFDGFSRFFVQKPGWKETTYLPMFNFNRIIETQELQPNESLEVLAQIWLDKRGIIFSETGTYKLWVSYGKLMSHTKEIVIIEPQDETDKELEEVFKDKGIARYLYFGVGTMNDPSEHVLTNLISKYRMKNSTYLQYVKYAVACSFTRRKLVKVNDKKFAWKNPDLNEAVIRLEEIKDDIPSRFHQEKVYYELYEACKETKQDGKAETIRKKYLEKYRDGVYTERIMNKAGD